MALEINQSRWSRRVRRMEVCIMVGPSQWVTLDRTLHLSFLICNLGPPPTKAAAKSRWDKTSGQGRRRPGRAPGAEEAVLRVGCAHCCHQASEKGQAWGLWVCHRGTERKGPVP